MDFKDTPWHFLENGDRKIELTDSLLLPLERFLET
jgi:hypothetical protein